VPYYFKHDLERLKDRFNKEGMAFAVLSGKNAERVIDRWNGGYTPILLLHPQSAGHGLNLQFGGHHLVWFTMLWSLERYLQTNARLARSGQKQVVGIHSILTRNTTDELMFMNLGSNGSDQQRFRAALRSYQQLRGLGLYGNTMEGLGL
jgi:SNF2 family DNA or RNA helicase